MKIVADKFLLYLTVAGALLFALPAQAESFTVFTNIIPPYKMIRDGQPSGMAGDLLVHLLANTGHTIRETRTMTHREYLSQAFDMPGAVYLALARDYQDKRPLKWVGPIFSANTGIVVKKSSGLRLERIDDATGLILASIIESSPEKMLLDKAIPRKQFLRFDTAREAIHALADGRADGLLMADAGAYSLMQAEGINPRDYRTALVLEALPLYFAFDWSTPDETIAQLQSALDAMKRPDETGMSPYLKVLSRYY